MADINKIQQTEDLVDKKKADAEQVYNQANDVSGDSWADELMSDDVRKQPKAPKMVQSAPKGTGDTWADAMMSDDVRNVKQPVNVEQPVEQNTQPAPVQQVENVDNNLYKGEDLGQITVTYDKSTNKQDTTVEQPTAQAQPQRPVYDYTKAPEWKGEPDTWKYTRTIKTYNESHPLAQAARHAKQYGDLLSAGELSAVYANKDWDDLNRQSQELMRNNPSKQNTPQFEHDAQLLSAIHNQMVALEYNFADRNDMYRNIGQKNYRMFLEPMRKGNKYTEFYENLYNSGANLRNSNPLLQYLPEKVEAQMAADEKAGKKKPDNYYYNMALKDKDFQERYHAWSFFGSIQDNMGWNEYKNLGAKASDLREERYKEESAKRFAESSLYVPVSALLDNSVAQAVMAVGNAYDVIKGQPLRSESVNDLLQRSMKYAGEGNNVTRGVLSFIPDATSLMVGTGVAARGTVGALAKVFTLTPKAMRLATGGLSFMYYEMAKSALGSWSQGREIDWAEMAGNSAKGFLLGAGGSLISEGVAGIKPNINNTVANYAIQGAGKVAETGLFASTEMAMAYLGNDKEATWTSSLLNNGALIISMAIGHGIGNGFGFKSRIGNATIEKVRKAGYNTLANEMAKHTQAVERGAMPKGYSQAAIEEMQSMQQSMGSNGLSWSDYAEVLKPTNSKMTKPGTNSIEKVEDGKGYRIVSYDVNGVEIERSKVYDEVAVDKEFAKRQRQVEKKREKANVKSFDLMRDSTIKAKAARSVADRINFDDGKSVYNGDGTVNEAFDGITADDVLYAYEVLSEKPAEQRSSDEARIVALFDEAVRDYGAEMPDSNAVKKTLCERYGVEESAFDAAWKADAKDRKGKEAEICATYNSIMSRPYEVALNGGEAGTVDGRQVSIKSTVKTDADGMPLDPNQRVYYDDGTGVKVTTAEHVLMEPTVEDPGELGDRISNENLRKALEAKKEALKSMFAEIPTDVLESNLDIARTAIENGEDTDGSMRLSYIALEEEIQRRRDSGVEETVAPAAEESAPIEIDADGNVIEGEESAPIEINERGEVIEPEQSIEPPKADNEIKPVAVPEVDAERDRKIDELLDFMGYQGKEREDARDSYLASPEALEEDYNDYLAEVQKEEPKKEEPVEEKAPAPEEEPPVDNSPQEQKVVDNLDEPMPLLEDGEPNVDFATPRRTRKYLYEESGLEAQDATDKIDYEIKKAKENAKKTEKGAPKMGDKGIDGNIGKFKKAQQEWNDKKAAADAKLEYWNEVKRQQGLYDLIDEISETKNPKPMADLVVKLKGRFKNDREILNALNASRVEPRTVHEACMLYLSGGARFVWDSEGARKGLKQELGYGEEERKKMIGLLSKDGTTVQKAVHDIIDQYGADLGLDLSESQVVYDALLEALGSISTKGDIYAFINECRLHAVEDILRKRLGNGDVQSREEAEADARANEEFETLKEQYKDELPENPTEDDVLNLMEQKRLEQESQPQEDNQSEGSMPNENGISDDFFNQSEEEQPPFSLKQEGENGKETVAKDVREYLEKNVGKELTDRIEDIAKRMGVEVRLTDRNVNGIMSSGVLYIGKNLDPDKTAVFVAGHELTHEMQHRAESKGSDVYDIFKDAALEWARLHLEEEGKGYDLDFLKDLYKRVFKDKFKKDALGRGMSEAEADAYAEQMAGQRVDDDYIKDEIAANVAGRMLENPAIAEDMFKLREAETPQERRTRLQRILDWIKEYISKRIGNKREEELSPEEQRLLELRDKFNDMYNEVVREDLDAQGIETADNGDAAYSIRSLPDKDQREKLIEGLMQQTGRSRRTVEKWLKSETSLASMIMRDLETLDYTPDPRDPAIKSNSDYPQGTVDFSNICRKRKDFTSIYSILQKENPNRVFTALDLEEIRQTMIEDGYTVACGLCFVEDRRQLLGEIAEDFINRLQNNDLKPASQKKLGDDTYVPTIAELITPEGSKRLAEEHPTVWEAFRAHNNARGQQAGRLYEGYNEYKREILNWNDSKVKKVNDAGGLRIFSFSDFEAPQLLDIIQVIEDCSSRGVKIQGYTKVPEFAKAMSKTGVKINQSLIPKGDGYKVVDGKEVLDYDPVEGIDINDKNFVRDPNNPNIGTILVGINDKQIRLAMVDPFVDYIIPFHTKIAKEVLTKKGIGNWTNYKNFQRDHDLSTGRAAEKEVNIYTDVLQAAEAEGNPITNKREFVEKFLKVCEERGLEPRFSQFLDKDANGKYIYTEGYHKFLPDFKLFDKKGRILPQEVVKPIFDDAFNKEILDNYSKDAKVEKDYSDTLGKLRERLGLEAPRRTRFEDMAEQYSLKEDLGREDIKDNDPSNEGKVRYSLREEDPPKKKGIGYKVFYLKDGKLYPPMVANLDRGATPVGVWLNADAAPVASVSKTGRMKVKAGGKGTQGSGGPLAYRPGWHLGEIPYALQFNRGEKIDNPLGIRNKKGEIIKVGELFPGDFVWAEVEYANDIDYQKEAMSYGYNDAGNFQHSLAGLPRIPKDGSYKYRTNANPATDPWIITGAMRVNKILKPSEVDEMVRAAGREPQKREANAVTDEQIEQLNRELGLSSENISEAQYSLKEDERRPTFYSNAARAVENIKQNKATAEQWLAMIKKNGGLKAGEDKWMGLSQWLEDNKGKSLTKEEVQQFIADNGIEMEEVNYGENGERVSLGIEKGDIIVVGHPEYTVVDRKDPVSDGWIYTVMKDGKEVGTVYNSGHIVNLVEKDLKGERRINPTRLEYTTKGLDNKREIAFKVPSVEPYKEYDGIHFGVENEGKAVMWVRFGETYDADGNKVLVIDEIQSNRHQEGRKSGYRSEYQNSPHDKYQDAVAAMEDFQTSMEEKYGEFYLSDQLTAEERKEYDRLYKALNETGDASIEDKKTYDVPDAPFEHNWHEVAMKRMLRLAAEEGIDKVAWTTGEQQAKRYSLGRMYDSIEREDNPSIDGKRFVLSGRNMDTFLVNKEGNIEDSSFSEFNGKPLSDVVGKDLAERMMNLKDGDMLEGEDLRIGGEGMKGFYDNMLPRFMDKYGKRWGTKTGEVQLATPGKEVMHSVDVTPEMKESVMEGQPLFSLHDNESSGSLAERLRERMRQRMERSRAGQGGGEPPVEPPTPLAPATPEPAPELPPTGYDRPMSPIEMAQEAAIKAVADTKASLEQRNTARRELDASLRNLHKAMRLQKEYDRTTVENVVSLCKMMVQSGLIDRRYISNLTPLFTKLKDSTGKEDLTSTVNGIMDVMLKSQERSIRNELNTLLNTKAQRINQSGVVTQGGVDLRGQRTLQSLNENFGKSVEDIDRRITQLEDLRGRIPENSEERLNEVDDKIQGALLAKAYMETAKNHEDNITAAEEELAEIKAQYKDGELGLKEYTEQKHALEAQIRSYRMSHADAMWDYVNTMRGIVAEGRSRAKDFIEEQKAHKNEIRHNAYSDMAGAPQYTQSRPGGLAKAVNSSVSQFVSSSLYTLDTMLRQLGHKHAKGEGYLYERFGRGWLDARDNEIRDYWADREELDKKTQELFGVKHFANLIDAIRKMPKMDVPYKDGGDIMNHTLDQAQLMYIYMVNKMEDGIVKLRRMGISEEEVETIKNFMNPKLVELADWLQNDFLPSRREGYNEVHRRMFGADMDMVENYVPLRIDKGNLTETVDINNGQNEPSLASTVTGGIIKRTHNTTPIDIMGTNAIDMILEHLDEMNHWKNFAEWNRDVNTLLSDKTFRNKVKNTTTIYGSGDKLWKHLKDVFFIAGGTYKPKGEGIDKAMVNIAKGVSAAKVSFRMFTATKQLLSLPVFAANCNVGYMVKNMAKPAGSWNWCMENLPSFKQRWKSRIAGDTRLEDTDIDWQYTHKKWVEKASKWGLSPNAFVDAMTVAVGARSVYEQRYKRYRKDGYDDVAADRRARQDATAAFNQTQQSSEKMFVAPMQVDRTVLAVGASLFRNASMGYERQFVEGLRNLKHLFGKERVVDEDGNVSTVSYKTASIEFMKKQMERNGLTETQAESAAKRIYNRSIWRNALKIAMFGFGAQMAWNLGGKLPYLAAQGYNAIYGDDDERKQAGANTWDTTKEALWHAAAGGWLEGLPFGNVVSDGINNEINGENFFKFSPDLLPFFGDTEDVANHFDGKNKLRGATDLVNLGAQIFIGVNPQTFLDVMTGIVDITAGKKQSQADFGTAKEALLLTMRIMQCPQSQLDQLYIDELGMNARQAQNLTPEQVARRYAFYKAHHDVPYLWHLYNQEKQDELIKQYETNFSKKLNEDVKEAGGTPEDYHDLMDSSTTNKEHDKYRSKEIDALSAQGPEALMKAWEKERNKGAAADYKYIKSLMTRYQKDVYGKGKTPDDADEAYEALHGEDIKEQALKIGRDLGFGAQDSYFQMSQYKAQHTSAKDPVMKEFSENDGGFKYSKKGKFFKMDEYNYKVPVEDTAKREKALKVMKNHKEELRRNYRNGWRMAKIKALYKDIEAESLKKERDSEAMQKNFEEILQLLEDERKDAAQWEKDRPTVKFTKRKETY